MEDFLSFAAVSLVSSLAFLLSDLILVIVLYDLALTVRLLHLGEAFNRAISGCPPPT